MFNPFIYLYCCEGVPWLESGSVCIIFYRFLSIATVMKVLLKVIPHWQLWLQREKKVNNVDILDVNRQERFRLIVLGRICICGSHLGNNERGMEGVKDGGRPRKS